MGEERPDRRNLGLDGHFEVLDLSLAAGVNVFRVRAFDSDGNIGVAEVTVTLEASQSVELPPVAPVQEGARFTIPIIISSAGDIAAVTFDLAYDTNFLSSPEFTWTDASAAPVRSVKLDTPGLLHAAISLSGKALPAGDYVLANIEFRPRSVAENLDALLNLQVAGIFAANGDPILSGTEVKSGKVTIVQRTVTGDNNANDLLDIGDASVILRLVQHLEPTRQWDITLNDVDQSATLDSADALQVLRTSAHITPQPRPAPTGLRALATAVGADSVTLTSDKSQLHIGDQVTVRALIKDRAVPLFGSAFKLAYPATALHLQNAWISSRRPYCSQNCSHRLECFARSNQLRCTGRNYLRSFQQSNCLGLEYWRARSLHLHRSERSCRAKRLDAQIVRRRALGWF